MSIYIHGQNENESLNGIVWKQCPKTVFVSKKVIEMAVNSAVISFNNGFVGLSSVFDFLGISVGYYTRNGFIRINEKRIKSMESKSTDIVKKRQQKL